MLRNIFWKVGVLGDYKIEFWKFALRRLARGEIEYLISSMLVGASPDHVCARGLGRSAQCVELFDAAARGLRPCRVIANEDKCAVAAVRSSDLRELTPARVGLGLAGASLPTKALLEFTLDHARARDAVHAGFDVPAMMQGLGDLGLEASSVSSQAPRPEGLSQASGSRTHA